MGKKKKMIHLESEWHEFTYKKYISISYGKKFEAYAKSES